MYMYFLKVTNLDIIATHSSENTFHFHLRLSNVRCGKWPYMFKQLNEYAKQPHEVWRSNRITDCNPGITPRSGLKAPALQRWDTAQYMDICNDIITLYANISPNIVLPWSLLIIDIILPIFVIILIYCITDLNYVELFKNYN